MVVKILSSSSANFHGVEYNDKKIDKGKGELMLMENFPSFIKENSSQDNVKNYLKSISKNDKITKPQFHAVISTKYQEHSKEELTEIGKNFMSEMGYKNQPFIIVFHNDTENNHIHIVSTRVNKETGKKINDSFEKLKSQKAIENVLEKKYGENLVAKIEKLLQYKVSSIKQLETLFKENGFKLVKNKTNENSFDILKNGVQQKTISLNNVVLQNNLNENRQNQIKAILFKYKEIYSNKVFKVIDDRELKGLTDKEINEQNKIKIDFHCELQKKLKEVFGIEIVFHHQDDKKPFGFTLIDNSKQSIYKGSEILKMDHLFEFTNKELNKKTFETIKDFNVNSDLHKQLLMQYFNEEINQQKENLEEFMIFHNKNRKELEAYRLFKSEVNELVKNIQGNKELINNGISLIKYENVFYALDYRSHQIQELSKLIGDKKYQEFTHPVQIENKENTIEKSNTKNQKDVLDILLTPNYTTGSSTDDLLKKKRKKRR